MLPCIPPLAAFPCPCMHSHVELHVLFLYLPFLACLQALLCSSMLSVHAMPVASPPLPALPCSPCFPAPARPRSVTWRLADTLDSGRSWGPEFLGAAKVRSLLSCWTRTRRALCLDLRSFCIVFGTRSLRYGIYGPSLGSVPLRRAGFEDRMACPKRGTSAVLMDPSMGPRHVGLGFARQHMCYHQNTKDGHSILYYSPSVGSMSFGLTRNIDGGL